MPFLVEEHQIGMSLKKPASGVVALTCQDADACSVLDVSGC